MKIRVSEATPEQLDRLVAQIEGVPYTYQHVASGGYGRDSVTQRKRRFSTDWFQGGPIIERERINLEPFTSINGEQWLADSAWDSPTPLIAAMRCFVASKLGDEAEVPDELT